MKKIIFSAAFLLIVVTSFSQVITDKQVLKNYYLQKSKNQKTTAWVLLGTGTALIGVGLIDGLKTSNDLGDIGGIWTVALPAGVLADLVSIPFFSIANKNKKKAASITVSNRQIYSPFKQGFTMKTQPTVTVSIPF